MEGEDVRGHGHRVRRVALDQAGRGDVHRQPALGSGEELPVRVDRQLRHVEHVRVHQPETEQVGRLLLDGGPGGHAVRGRTAQQPTGRDRPAVGVVRVLTQEDLVGRVGGVGLRLVHVGRVGVQGVLHVVAGPQLAVGSRLVLGPGQHHEGLVRRHLVAGAGLAVGALGPQGVVGTQRHEDRSAALDRLVDAVVEELAEEREQGVVGRGQPHVGGDVRDEQSVPGGHATSRCTGHRWVGLGVGVGAARERAWCVLGTDRVPRRRDRGRVGRGLVDDQVADVARLGVHDAARLLLVRRRPRGSEGRPFAGVTEGWSGQPGEHAVRGSVRLAAPDEVVAGAVHRPQAVGGERVRDLVRTGAEQSTAGAGGRGGAGDVRLRDLDLLEDEGEVSTRHGETLADRRLRVGQGRRTGAEQHEGESQGCGDGADSPRSPGGGPRGGGTRVESHERHGCSFEAVQMPIPEERVAGDVPRDRALQPGGLRRADSASVQGRPLCAPRSDLAGPQEWVSIGSARRMGAPSAAAAAARSRTQGADRAPVTALPGEPGRPDRSGPSGAALVRTRPAGGAGETVRRGSRRGHVAP